MSINKYDPRLQRTHSFSAGTIRFLSEGFGPSGMWADPCGNIRDISGNSIGRIDSFGYVHDNLNLGGSPIAKVDHGVIFNHPFGGCIGKIG